MTHNPGGKSRFPLAPNTIGYAWRDDHPRCPFALWVCMNPSTAMANEDDPLVRKVQGFTNRMGLESFILMNAATYRMTDPKLLPKGITLSHVDNLISMRAVMDSPQCVKIIAACGVPPKVMIREAKGALALMRQSDRSVFCLGKTADGWPKHPGRIGYDTQLEPFT